MLLRPSIKFYYNIFLLKESLSFIFTHSFFIHIFLSTQNLKIKFFKNKINLKYIKYISVFYIILLAALLIIL